MYLSEENIKKEIDLLYKELKNIRMVGKKSEEDLEFSLINKSIAIGISDSKKSISRVLANHNHAICCMNKPLDPLNNKFYVRIDKNPVRNLWIGACILDVVRANNFTSCNGVGKGTYAIDQYVGANYNNANNYATFSHHTNQQFNNTNYGSAYNAVMIFIIQTAGI
jgi:hypothetical protein